MTIVKTPKNFNHNSIQDFLDKVAFIFNKIGKEESGFQLNFLKSKEITIVGLLLIYKVMVFTLQYRCFSNPNLNDADSGEFNRAQNRYRFKPLIDALRNKPKKRTLLSLIKGDEDLIETAYENLNVYIEQEKNNSSRFLIAPQPMLRGNPKTRESLKYEYSPNVIAFYNKPAVSEIVLNCISEIYLNFWLHALDDDQSVLVAEGTLNKIEIACADTGSGIISTLRNGLERLKDADDLTIIREAVKQNVSSKVNSDHLGSGLFIIDRITQLSGGLFHIYSEGAYYKRINQKVEVGKCGYWKGTIVYLNLPLNKTITMDEVFEKDIVELNKIEVNFV